MQGSKSERKHARLTIQHVRSEIPAVKMCKIDPPLLPQKNRFMGLFVINRSPRKQITFVIMVDSNENSSRDRGIEHQKKGIVITNT